MADATNELIMQAREIVAAYQRELGRLTLHPYPERDNDLVIVQSLLQVIDQSLMTLKGSHNKDEVSGAIDRVIQAFDHAENQKMTSAVNRFIATASVSGKQPTDVQLERVRDQEMRRDSWGHWLLLSTGQHELRDVLIDFKQEGRKTLPMLASAIQAQSHGVR